MMRLSEVEFHYPGNPFGLRVDSLELPAGQSLALTGPSGSGKTTLLQLICGLQRPQRGRVELDGVELTRLGEQARRAHRIRKMGLVFQDFALIDYLSVRENLLLPARLDPALQVTAELRQRADHLAETLGLADKRHRPIPQLSQGERQRVAVGRALLLRPRLVLADEPTGNLDPDNARRVLELLTGCVRDASAALVVVTHDRGLLAGFDRHLDCTRFAHAGAGGVPA